MILQLQLFQTKKDISKDYLQVADFFRQSSGKWRSQRRYYTLPYGEIKEMVSLISVDFLEKGCRELQHLAGLHELSHPNVLACGTRVSWKSTNPETDQKQSEGAMVFGVLGKTLYRDRGFTTSQPVIAEYHFTNPQTLCLRTEHNDSVFEEEFKLISHNCRTRQTVISRANEQQMVGQYLETRILD